MDVAIPQLPPLPPFPISAPPGPPPARRDGDWLLVADAIVAELPGFRPLTLDLVRLAEPAAPPPVVLWIHGGAWLTGTPKRMSEALAHGHIVARLVNAGYAVASVSYRLSGEARFPAQLHDVKAAARWLRRHAAELGVDGERIAAWGESAGGHLASLLALTGDQAALAGESGLAGVSDAIRAAVVWYGPSDLLSMQAQAHPRARFDHNRPDSPESLLVGGPVQQNPALAQAASPVSHVSASAPPMLIAHGVEDVVVPAGQSEQLHAALVAAGAPAELRLVPGADHCFVGVDLAPLVREAIEFLNRAMGRH